MELAAAIHARWAADPTLNRLLPAARLTTGVAPGGARGQAYATLGIAGGRTLGYANDRSSVDELKVVLRIGHADYAAGSAVVDAVLAAFDRSAFALAGGGKVVCMQRSGWPGESQEADRDDWLWTLEFQCHVHFPSGA